MQTLSDAKIQEAKLQKKRANKANFVGLVMHNGLVGILWKTLGKCW